MCDEVNRPSLLRRYTGQMLSHLIKTAALFSMRNLTCAIALVSVQLN